MDSLPDSPELPYNYDAVSAGPFELLSWLHEEDAELDRSAEEKVSTPKPRRKRVKIPGCSTLNVMDLKVAKRTRSKYEPINRQKVARVRRLGACLRCKAMKISVRSANLIQVPQLLTYRNSAPKKSRVKPVKSRAYSAVGKIRMFGP